MNNFITRTKSLCVKSIQFLLALLKQSTSRSAIANFLMVGFIIFTSMGAGMVSPALGFISAGVTCGILGFLLGLE